MKPFSFGVHPLNNTRLMLQTNENVFSMWDTLIAFLLNNKTTWQDHKPFAKGVQRLQDYRSAASKAGQGQIGHDSTDDTALKASLGDKMVRAAVLTAANAHAYAADPDVDDVALAKATDKLTTSYFSRLADTERPNAVDALVTMLAGKLTDKSVSDALNDYGVNTDSLADLSKMAADFRTSSGAGGAEIAEHKTATQTVDDVRRAGQSHLKSSLDKLIRNWEDTEPGFVGGYRAARVIRDLGSRGGGDDSAAAGGA